MSTTTTRNALVKPAYTDAADIGVINTNMDTIDASFAKCNWAGSAAPVTGDDDLDGYSIGSWWFDTTGHGLYIAEDVSTGKAVWRTVYPQGSSAHTSTNAPTVNDDTSLGYSIGSLWVKTDTDYAYIATDVTTGKAVWKTIWPADLTGAVLANGTVPLTADWSVGAYDITSTADLSGNTLISTVGVGTAPVTVTSTTVCTNLHAANSDALNGIADTGFVKQTLADDKGDIIVASGADAWSIVSGKSITNGYVLTYNSGATNNMAWAAASGGASFWTTFPGSPSRTGNNSFTCTDTSHANLYDYQLSKGTLLKWTEDTAPKIAMVTLASNTSDTDTFYICGDAMAKIDASSLKYCLMKAERFDWAVPGTLAASTTDASRQHVMPCNAFGLQAEAFLKTAGSTSGATTFDIKDDGTSIMASSSAITIAYTASNNLDATGFFGVKTNVNYHASTLIAANSLMSVDVGTVAGTPPVEAYVTLWYMPRYYFYRS